VIDFAPDVPRWTQVADVIRLRAEFGIAQATARKVLSRLRAEGATCTVPGPGSFAAETEGARE
jgi:GntR family transcriptional regulator